MGGILSFYNFLFLCVRIIVFATLESFPKFNPNKCYSEAAYGFKKSYLIDISACNLLSYEQADLTVYTFPIRHGWVIFLMGVLVWLKWKA